MAKISEQTAELPGVIAVFPLDSVLLPPRGLLPLNVFEPRYLNMIDDAMAAERIIGMVQTRPGGDRERPSLMSVGGAGRITSFAETQDGRYLITLTGVSRFRLMAELSSPTPYRQVRADFRPFELDLSPPEEGSMGREALLSTLRRYLHGRHMDIDWTMAADAPLEALVNSLSMALPLGATEKQALLEAVTVADRIHILTVLLNMNASGEDGDEPTTLQ